MNINLSLSPATTIINKLAVVIYKTTSPNTPVSSQEFNPPHNNPRNLTFSNVDVVSYIVNTYETTGLPSTGTLRHSFIYDPSFTSADIRPTEFLYMIKGGTSYTDASWIGWEIESIERVGVGTQYSNDDLYYYIKGNGYRQDGFDLKRSDDSFGDNEKFVVRFYPRITVGTPVIQSANIFTGTEIITGNVEIDSSYAGKMLVVNSTNPIVNITMKSIASLGNYGIWGFASEGGNQVTVSIKSKDDVDSFLLKGSTDEIIIGQSERVLMMADPVNGFIVISYSDGILRAGQFIDAYDFGNEPNCKHCTGALLSRTIYKRLWKAVQAMPAGSLVSDTVWNDTSAGQNNKGKFSTGDGVNNFRIPQIYAAGVVKAVDGSTSLAGVYEADQVGEFTDDIPLPIANTDSGVNGLADGNPIGNKNFTVTLNAGKENKVRTFGYYRLLRF